MLSRFVSRESAYFGRFDLFRVWFHVQHIRLHVSVFLKNVKNPTRILFPESHKQRGAQMTFTPMSRAEESHARKNRCLPSMIPWYTIVKWEKNDKLPRGKLWAGLGFFFHAVTDLLKKVDRFSAEMEFVLPELELETRRRQAMTTSTMRDSNSNTCRFGGKKKCCHVVRWARIVEWNMVEISVFCIKGCRFVFKLVNCLLLYFWVIY